jgi:hypothetical protein
MTEGEKATVRLRIEVRGSSETQDQEVLLFGDEQNLIDRFGEEGIGLDPDDLLVESSALIAQEDPREVVIGRCECGTPGCGDVRVSIAGDQEFVTWSAVSGPREPVHFDAPDYDREIQRALSDHSWETPGRTVARWIRTRVDRELLASRGLEYSWAAHRIEEGLMQVALTLQPGPYSLLVDVPWDESGGTSRLADAIVALLSRAPSTWTGVTWLPQVKGLRAPVIAGSGWQEWRGPE